MRTSPIGRNERIIALRDEGITYDAIAAELNVSRNVVSGVLMRAGKTDPNNYCSHNTSRERVSAAYKDLVLSEYMSGKTGKEVAEKHGFHPATLSVWRRMAGLNPKTKAILSPEDVVKIRAMRADGHKLKDIAEKFGVHPNYVCKIALGQARA